MLRAFLCGNTGNLGLLDDPIYKLKLKADREDGYNRDEALRCIAAAEAFKVAFRKLQLGNATFLPGPQDVEFIIEGVRVNVRLDPPIMDTNSEGQSANGGCVLFLANTPEARRNIDERRRYVAAIVHWALEMNAANFEPLARLCVSFDAFGGEIVKAPSANERLRRRGAAACREARDCWSRIDPPAGYDGPAWKPISE